MVLPSDITETTETAATLLLEYSWLALFFIFVLEGAMLLYFAPSESLVPFAIVSPLTSTQIDILLVLVIAVTGATIGQVSLFLVAKYAGREYLLGKRWFRISEDRLAVFDNWFERWGPIVIPLSNTMLFTRGMLTVPAGFAGMSTIKFALLSALGTLSFQLILAGITLGILDFVF